MLTAPELIAFEREVADRFNAGEIRAPVHLAGGNEDALLQAFRAVRENDWVLSTWRSHYHCLLKGVPRERLMADIIAGRSISLCYPEYRILSSAIVGGCLPIAVGLGWAIKRARRDDRVFVFCGDMAAATGSFSECSRYAYAHGLPVNFMVEDNGISVCTDTASAWGGGNTPAPAPFRRIKYELPWPHSGAGKRIEF